MFKIHKTSTYPSFNASKSATIPQKLSTKLVETTALGLMMAHTWCQLTMVATGT